MRKLKWIFFLASLHAFTGCHSENQTSTIKLSIAPDEECARPWVFFDLGETIVDTQTFNFEKVLYMPGAQAYIEDLHAKSYNMGLIVNIPEQWGSTQEEKLAALKALIDARWIEATPFPWHFFGDHILLPPNDTRRKPHPYLFDLAMKNAKDIHCASVYEGEVEEEVVAASNAGMHPFLVGQLEAFFMPEDQLREIKLP